MSKMEKKLAPIKVKSGRGVPPPADYCDEVTLEQFAELAKLVEPLDFKSWEKVRGPAW